MNKKDFKYIIKRILIGVGIILCVGFLNKCSVKAESTYQLYLNVKNYDLPNLSTTKYNDINNIDYSFDIGSYTINLNDVISSNDTTDLNYYSLVFKSDNDDYIILTNSGIRNIPNVGLSNDLFDYIIFDEVAVNYINKSNNDEIINFDDYRGYWNLYVLSQDSSFISTLDSFITNNFSLNNYSTQIYVENNLPGILNYVYGISAPTVGDTDIYNVMNYFYNNYNLVHISLDMELDDNVLVPDSNVIPSYFTQINMKNYDSVYFVPKNYSTVPVVSVNDVVFINFDYYYQGNFKDGYFPLQDTSVMVSSFSDNISLDNRSFIDTMFPLSENGDTTGYQYYAYIIYNNNKSVDSYIYYDSRYFDYYLVEDMKTYTYTINIINKDNESQSISIIFDRNFQQIWEQGLNGSYTTINSENRSISSYVGSLADIITRPFTFLKNVRDGTCSSFKAPIPFLGNDIEFPCMSSIYHNILGNFYDIFSLLINGLILYYCIIKNVESLKHNIQPEYTKLDVINL